MTVWTWLWLAWGVLFLVIEGVALANREHGDTLSEHVWRLFGIGRPGNRPAVTGSVRLRRFLLLAFMAWLALHFLTGGLF